VEFIGCPADGQDGYLVPPHGSPVVLPVAVTVPAPIAYYKSSQGPGAFAPAGWHCFEIYGSSGGMLLITQDVQSDLLHQKQTVSADAVEVSLDVGGTSGRFEVARIAHMYFRNVAKSFIHKIVTEDKELPAASTIAQEKYASDHLTYRSSTVVEVYTPPKARGFGTERNLTPTSTAIRSLAILSTVEPEWPNLCVIRVRLGPKALPLISALLDLNERSLRQANGC